MWHWTKPCYSHSLYCKLDIFHGKYTWQTCFPGQQRLPYYTDAAALHYLFQEDEAKKKKQTPETEISQEEQKLATKFTGPTWYRKNFKRPITAEIEEPFDTKKRQKRAGDLD